MALIKIHMCLFIIICIYQNIADCIKIALKTHADTPSSAVWTDIMRDGIYQLTSIS